MGRGLSTKIRPVLEIPAKPPQWKTATGRIPKRLMRTASDEAAKKDGCRFSRASVDWVVEILRKFVVHDSGKWYGQPFEPTTWQIENILEPIYGWIEPPEKKSSWKGNAIIDGRRRFQNVFIQAPKKTPGKSTLCAGLATVAMLEEPGALVYMIAATKEQASSVCFQKFANSCDMGPLSSYINLRRMAKEVDFPQSNALVKAVANKPMSGPSLSCVILDEIHEWRDDEAWHAMRSAGRDRFQALFIAITNAGADLETLCHRLYMQSKEIESGERIQKRWYTRIFEAPKAAAEAEIRAVGDGSDKIPVALSVNPHIGLICSKSELLQDIRDASKSDWEIANLLRFTYCVWKQRQSHEWLGPYWDACQDQYSEEGLAGEVCYAGIDLARSRDWTAMSLIFPDGEFYRVLPYFWIPEARAKQLAKLIPIDSWIEDGYVRTMPGEVTYYKQLMSEIVEILEPFDCRSILYDKHNGESVLQEIGEETEVEIVPFGQSHQNYNDCTKELERLVFCGSLRHNGHPALTWQAQNAVRDENTKEHIMPQKRSKNDYRTIDGIHTICMALAQGMLANQDIGRYYENHGLELL